jgi:hypothetical protein
MTKLDEFKEEWYALSASERCRIYLDYLREYDTEKAWYGFDEKFFQTFFEDNPMEAVRATFFGKIESWSDDYIRFNAYGNLESASKYQVENYANDYIEEIFDHPELWEHVIAIEDEEENEEELING